MKTFFVSLALLLSSSTSFASQITSSAEQRKIVEELSGVSQLGIGGLPSVISQRFSDSPEIFTAAEYLVKKYRDQGIEAAILEYNPQDAFPYYYQNTDDTYRSYFRHLLPQLTAEFNGYCDNTLSPEKRDTVIKRLIRVGVDEKMFCQTPASNRVETYIRSTVDHTTLITKEMIERRVLTTWPNVLAIVETAKSSEETGARPLCVIGAHLDSVARDGGGRGPIVSPTTLAPGADDNGSGTAAVVTLARALRDWVKTQNVNFPCDLAFAHFSGEEEGLLGSLVFAHQQLNRPVSWMVNFDMIAYNGGPKARMNVGYDSRFGRTLPEAFAGASDKIESVIVERETFIYSSDQIAFWGIGVPAISISEQACTNSLCSDQFKYFNPNLHTSKDTVDVLDFDYAAAIIEHSYGGFIKLLSTYKSN